MQQISCVSRVNVSIVHNHSLFSLLVKDCGAAPNLVNGRYTGFSTTYGSVQTAQCDIDYKLKGSKTAKCEDSGWSYDGEKPTCQGLVFSLLWLIAPLPL